MKTDYGIRVISYLYQKNDQFIPAHELAEKTSVSYPYLTKVLRILKGGGLIEVTQGRHGGYRIVNSAINVSLYDVIVIMQGELTMGTCLEDGESCNRNNEYRCPVHNHLKTVQEEAIHKLESIYVSDFTRKLN